MMQFSVAPWRVPDPIHLAAVKRAMTLRALFTPVIMKLAREAAGTGVPIVRSLEYVFPHQGLENIQDEFMLGDDWLVAPVLTASSLRKIIFPAGNWRDTEGKVYKGPVVTELIFQLTNWLFSSGLKIKPLAESRYFRIRT